MLFGTGAFATDVYKCNYTGSSLDNYNYSGTVEIHFISEKVAASCRKYLKSTQTELYKMMLVQALTILPVLLKVYQPRLLKKGESPSHAMTLQFLIWCFSMIRPTAQLQGVHS